MIDVNKFKPGITFKKNGSIFSIINAHHSKQGRGQASVKVKVKNLRSGAIIIQSYISGDKVEKAYIEIKDMNYLYNDGKNAILMDKETFEQIEIPISKIKQELHFMSEGNIVKVRIFESKILDIFLPSSIELKVVEAPDAIKGNTTNNPQKFIKVETGLKIEVPMFIKKGENIIISTDTGKYLGRSN